MGGCWTCRARKKRCGQQTPSCDECDRLGLECNGYGARPVWADGGRKEHEYKMSLKEGIKQRHRYKRQKSLTERPETPPQICDAQVDSIDMTDGLEDYFNIPFSFSKETPCVEVRPFQQLLPIAAFTTMNLPDCSSVEEAIAVHGTYFPDLDEIDFDMQYTAPKEVFDKLEQTSAAEECQLLLHYLDSVFWRQHPGLQQTTTVPDRSWILVFFHSSQIFKDTLLYVSKHLSVQQCEQPIQNGAFGDVLTLEIDGRGRSHYRHSRPVVSGDPYATSARTIIEKIQESANDLSFEENPSLTSVVALLATAALIAYYGVLIRNRDHVMSSLMISRTLLNLIQPSEEKIWTCPCSDSDVLGIEHILVSAFQTSYAQLLWLDAVEAATMGSSCLLEYNRSVDELCVGSGIECMFGCRSRILHALRQTIELREWKKACLTDGRLSMLELSRRSTKLLEQINRYQMPSTWRHDSSTATLAPESSERGGHHYRDGRPESFGDLCTIAKDDSWTTSQVSTGSQSRRLSSASCEDDNDVITQVYVQAITTYLQVVVLGANPGLLEIQSSITTGLGLLDQLSSIDTLACVQWPLMILSCLSTQSQREHCKGILGQAMHRPKLQRSYSDILDMTQKFWRLTGDIPTSMWDWESIIHRVNGYNHDTSRSLSI